MKTTVVFALVAAAISGCASVAVNDESLQSRTAFALGLQQSEFTISNRSDSGVRTDYTVTTTKKQVFSCYVTGTMSYTGRTISDAICTQVSSAAPGTNSRPNKSVDKPAPASKGCNDLLKAANKC